MNRIGLGKKSAAERVEKSWRYYSGVLKLETKNSTAAARNTARSQE